MAEAELLEVLEPGPRAEPFCAHFTVCGGCPWQAIPLEVQQATLEAHVRRALDGLGPTAPIVSTPPSIAWRATARLHWQARRGEPPRIGYHQPGTEAVLDIESCPVLGPPLPTLYAAVRRGLARHLRGRGTLRITAASGAQSGTLELAPRSARDAEALRAPLGRFVEQVDSCHGARLRIGRSTIEVGQPWDHLGPDEVPHPTGTFVQAHQPGNARLVAGVVDALGSPADGGVLELFAGSGNFTFALAAAGHRLTVVERSAPAVRALLAEARRRGCEQQITAETGDAARWPAGRYEAILIDPPRGGARAVVEALVRLGAAAPRRLVYVSCNPATLARDLRALAPAGWRLIEATPYDLFPHTGHVEVLAVLQRATGGSADG